MTNLSQHQAIRKKGMQKSYQIVFSLVIYDAFQ
jgi:hypothetical protein